MERREVVNASKEYDDPGEWSFTAERDPLTRATAYQFPAPSPASDQRTALQTAAGQRPAAGATRKANGVQVPSNEGVSRAGKLRIPGMQAASQPLCLYFGPGGERCYSPALADGFCPRHQLNPAGTAQQDQARSRKKKAAATIGIIAALWPILEELVRQIFRLLK